MFDPPSVPLKPIYFDSFEVELGTALYGEKEVTFASEYEHVDDEEVEEAVGEVEDGDGTGDGNASESS